MCFPLILLSLIKFYQVDGVEPRCGNNIYQVDAIKGISIIPTTSPLYRRYQVAINCV